MIGLAGVRAREYKKSCGRPMPAMRQIADHFDLLVVQFSSQNFYGKLIGKHLQRIVNANNNQVKRINRGARKPCGMWDTSIAPDANSHRSFACTPHIQIIEGKSDLCHG